MCDSDVGFFVLYNTYNIHQAQNINISFAFKHRNILELQSVANCTFKLNPFQIFTSIFPFNLFGKESEIDTMHLSY